MKIFTFFLALLFSLITVLNIIAASLRILCQAIIKKDTHTNMVPEFIFGVFTVILWTYFYYL